MSEFAELHDELRDVARDLLGGVADQRIGWDRAVELGWSGLEIDEAHDGSGATFAETAVVLEEVGRAAVASPLFGTAVLGVGALCLLEPSDGRDDLLRAIAAGEALVSVAAAPHGDDPHAAPSFRLDGERIDGHATFVADAPGAHHLLLVASDRGTPVVVRVDRAQVEVAARPVVDDSRDFGTVRADGVVVDDVWAFAGDPVADLRHLSDRGALAVTIDSMGVASAMLDATVSYVGERRQFDRVIGSFQSVKHQCADMLVGLTVGRELIDVAIEAVAAGAPDATAHVSRAKSFVTATAVDVVGSAMQLHGGIGYTWESGVHRYLKRAVLDRSWFGSPAAHRRRLATAFAD